MDAPITIAWRKTIAYSRRLVATIAVETPTLQQRIWLAGMAVAASLFIILAFTGILMSLHYEPSARELQESNRNPLALVQLAETIATPEGDTLGVRGEVRLFPLETDKQSMTPAEYSKNSFVSDYGSAAPVNAAYYSVYHRISGNDFLASIRSIHKVCTHLFIALLLGLVAAGAIGQWYRDGWEGAWFTVNAVAFVSLLSAYTGSLLPWSEFSATSLAIASGYVEHYFPVLGEYLADFIRSGRVVGEFSLPRAAMLHISAMPVIIVGCGMLWVRMMRTASPFSFLSFRRALLLTIPITTVLGIISVKAMSEAQYLPAQLTKPAHHLSNMNPAWYFISWKRLMEVLPSDIGAFAVITSLLWFVCAPFWSAALNNRVVLTLTLLALLIFAGLGIAYSS